MKNTIRSLVYTNPYVCNLCPNQPFLWLLTWLSSFMAPCKNELKLHIVWLQNDFKLHMWLWFVIIASLNENEDEKCSHIIQWLVIYENIMKQYKNIYENLVVFAISNVLHKWLNTITIRNPFNSNHSFVTCVQINHFCDFWCKCLSCHMVKMICNCIFNYWVI
jgi:hypothetical protein